MIDLDAITSIRPEIDLPTSAELATARRRLDDAVSQELKATEAVSTKGHGSPTIVPLRRRRPVRLALAGGVAVAAAGLAAIFAVPGSAPTRPLQGRPVAHLAAVRFLDEAAAASLQQPSSPPLPSQFVYGETENPDGTLTETWLSVDGSSDGLTRWTDGANSPDPGKTGGNDLNPPCSIALGEATGCTPFVGYYPDLPTDPNAVLAYLNKVGLVDTANNPSDDAVPGWVDNVVGKIVSELMASSYLLPAQQAALFELMAETPGFQIVSPMTDAIGRSGIGIEWRFEGGAAAVIFDPTTYAYLGLRTWPEGRPADPGAAYDGDALVKLAVVASAGEQP
jgi:hypothetical protein